MGRKIGEWRMNDKTKTNFCVNMLTNRLKTLNELVDKQYFPSRSVLVDYCVKIALPTILQECKKLDETREQMNELDLTEILEFLKMRGYVIRRGVQPTVKIPLGNIHFNSNNEKTLPILN
jgi:hypothetical protein